MNDPGAFILFNGVESNITKDATPVGYGSKFAAYIKEHKLGSVVKSVKRPNRNCHPDHMDQVWVWAPDVEALRKWWATRNPHDPKNKNAAMELALATSGKTPYGLFYQEEGKFTYDDSLIGIIGGSAAKADLSNIDMSKFFAKYR